MSTQTTRGSCLCGAVSYQIQGPYHFFQYCHCGRCRKASGSSNAANLMIPAANLTWLTGESLTKQYKLPAAERFSTRFCTQCGSRLPWTTPNGEFVIVPAGSLDEEPESLPQRHIYWGSRPHWCSTMDALPKFDEVQ
ncbi:MAG: GFA family protein [Gammaproteobacteria bacterium]|nr:GFA family protein [Gammaproteobacteria bacterium]